MEKSLIERVSFINFDSLETQGRNVYRKNSFFRDVGTFMGNSENHQFYKKYFKDINSIQQTVLFMTAYDIVLQKYPDLTPYQVIACIEQLMRNAEFRKQICEYISNEFKLQN